MASLETTPARAASRFEHSALYHRDAEGFLAGTLPFIADGLDAGEPVLVAVSQPRAESIERALGADRARVRFVDVRAFARNPARIIPFWREFLDDHRPRWSGGARHQRTRLAGPHPGRAERVRAQ